MSEVTKLQNEIEQDKQVIAYKKKVVELMNNPLFKEIIVDNFMTYECANYARMSSDVHLPEDSRLNALHMAQAAGHIERYLQNFITLGASAEYTLTRKEAALLELINEGVTV